jgi:hypothetical protein
MLSPNVDLLDQLPVLGDLMAHMPTRLHAQLYDALGIELLYRHDLNQVTIYATITPSTPRALAALLRQRARHQPARHQPVSVRSKLYREAR